MFGGTGAVQQKRWVVWALAAVAIGAGTGYVRVLNNRRIERNGMLNLRLQTALEHISAPGVKAALLAGADPNGEEIAGSGYTALMHSVEHGDPKIVHILLDNGADVNRKDSKGTTALQQARASGQAEIAKMLTDAGARN